MTRSAHFHSIPYLNTMPALKPIVTNIIKQVETLSGKKVLVQEDTTLQPLATVQTARGEIPFHLIRYRTNGQGLSYLITYQLGFLLRMFSCEKQERWEVASNTEEKRKAAKLLEDTNLPENVGNAIIDNLIIQLRTFAVGFRVDEWIMSECPELISEQNDSVNQQLAQNEQCLAPEIRERFPRFALNANSAMNAAYATYWSNKFNESRLTLPYQAMGYADQAAKLLATLAIVRKDPSCDRELIQQWGDELKLSDYFHFNLHQIT